MAEVTRIKVTQPDGETKKTVAFLSDIKLNTVAAGDLITVATNTDNKTATVSVDSTKLSLENDNVKINTPLEFAVQTTAPTETTGLRAVNIGGTTKLYWGNNVIEAHNPEEGYVTTADFNAHTGNEAENVKHVTKNQLDALDGIEAGETVITDTTFNSVIGTIETAIDTLEGITAGYTTENTIKDAVDGVDAKVDSVLNDVIGVWSSIRDTTVKAAIEANATEIAALKGNHFIVVSALPATGEPNCIYLIPKDGAEERNIKEEWIYVNNDWEKIGDTAVDLTEYAKTADVEERIADEAFDRIDADNALGTRLTTVEGKLTNFPEGKTIKQAIDEAVATEAGRATAVEGDLDDLTTDADTSLVAAINEVDAHADTAQTTANSALATASTAVQTVTGDANIDASKSGTTVTVGVKTGSKLEDILTICSFTTEEE